MHKILILGGSYDDLHCLNVSKLLPNSPVFTASSTGEGLPVFPVTASAWFHNETFMLVQRWKQTVPCLQTYCHTRNTPWRKGWQISFGIVFLKVLTELVYCLWPGMRHVKHVHQEGPNKFLELRKSNKRSQCSFETLLCPPGSLLSEFVWLCVTFCHFACSYVDSQKWKKNHRFLNAQHAVTLKAQCAQWHGE